MTTPTPATTPAAAPADFPGKTLGIVGLVLAILVPLVGLIISAVANSQSKAAGYPNQLAKIGIIVGAILTALGIIVGIIYAVTLGSLVASTSLY
jgi:hypothetical protein